MSVPMGPLLSLSYIWEVILGRSPGDSIVIMYKIFQFSRIELVLASMNLHLLSFLCLPVCLWGLVLCEQEKTGINRWLGWNGTLHVRITKWERVRGCAMSPQDPLGGQGADGASSGPERSPLTHL